MHGGAKKAPVAEPNALVESDRCSDRFAASFGHRDSLVRRSPADLRRIAELDWHWVFILDNVFNSMVIPLPGWRPDAAAMPNISYTGAGIESV
jgi:hypothetical protein